MTPMQSIEHRMRTVAARMKVLTFSTHLELDVTVECEVSGEHVPAQVQGRPEDCHPAEGPEVELRAVYVSTKRPDGSTAKVDILPALSPAEEQTLIDDAEWRADDAEEER